MKRTSLYICGLLLASQTLRSSAAGSVTLEVVVSQQVYRPGDTIEVSALVENRGDQPFQGLLTGTLGRSLPGESARTTSHQLELAPGETNSLCVFAVPVSDDFPPGAYEAAVSIGRDGVTVTYHFARFSVVDTLLRIEGEVSLARAFEPGHETRTFIPTDQIQISFRSALQDVAATASIRLDGLEQAHLALPGVYVPTRSGSYLLRVTLEKPGYKATSQDVNFAVIPVQPSIPTETLTLLPVLRGDLNGNGAVDAEDSALLEASFGKTAGMEGYDPRADLNGDHRVDQSDRDILAAESGQNVASFEGRLPPRLQVGVQSAQEIQSLGFLLLLEGQIGRAYEIQSSTNLENWNPLATVTNATTTLVWRDHTAANVKSRFYRALAK
jgi:hypothetical protein